MIPRPKQKQLTKAELTRELENLKSQIHRSEIRMYDRMYDTVLPLPPRVKILEQKLETLLNYLQLEIENQPEQFVVKKKSEKN